MKKTLCVFVIIATFFTTGCMGYGYIYDKNYFLKGKQDTSENYTMDKVESFIDEIENLAKENKHSFKIVTNEDQREQERTCLITIDKNQEILIEFENMGYQNGKEDSKVTIKYNVTAKKYFDLDIFKQYVDLISGREISIEDCDEFINKYVLIFPGDDERYENEVIRNVIDLNFWADWELEYIENENGSAKLEFWGLTK